MARTRSQNGSRKKEARPFDTTSPLAWRSPNDNKDSVLEDGSAPKLSYWYGTVTVDKTDEAGSGYANNPTTDKVPLHLGFDFEETPGDHARIIDSMLERQFFPLENAVAYTARGRQQYACAISSAAQGFGGFSYYDPIAGSPSAQFYTFKTSNAPYKKYVFPNRLDVGFVDTGHTTTVYGNAVTEGDNDYFQFVVPSSGEAKKAKFDSFIDGNYFTPESMIGGIAYTMVSGTSAVDGGTSAYNEYHAIKVERPLNQMGISKNAAKSLFSKNYYVSAPSISIPSAFDAASAALCHSSFDDFLSKCSSVSADPDVEFDVQNYPYVEVNDGITSYTMFAASPKLKAGSQKTIVDETSGKRTSHNGPMIVGFNGGYSDYNGFIFRATDDDSCSARVQYTDGLRLTKAAMDTESDEYEMSGYNLYDTNSDENTGKTVTLSSMALKSVYFDGAKPSAYQYVAKRLPYGYSFSMSNASGSETGVNYIPAIVSLSGSVFAENYSWMPIGSGYRYYGTGAEPDNGLGNSLVWWRNNTPEYVRVLSDATFVLEGPARKTMEELGSEFLVVSSDWIKPELSSNYSITVVGANPEDTIVPINACVLSAERPRGEFSILSDAGVNITRQIIVSNPYFFAGDFWFGDPENLERLPEFGEFFLKFGCRMNETTTDNVVATVYMSSRIGENDTNLVEIPLVHDSDTMAPGVSALDSSFGGLVGRDQHNILAIATNASSVSAMCAVDRYTFECGISGMSDIPYVKSVSTSTTTDIDGSHCTFEPEWELGYAYDDCDFRLYLCVPTADQPGGYSLYEDALKASLRGNENFVQTTSMDGKDWWVFTKKYATGPISIDFCNKITGGFGNGETPGRLKILAKADTYYGGERSPISCKVNGQSIEEIFATDVLVATAVKLSASTEVSNSAYMSNPVIYGDFSPLSKLGGSVKYNGGVHVGSGVGMLDSDVSEIAIGKSANVYISGSESGSKNRSYVYFGTGTAWNIPEVDYIKHGMGLSAFPEYSFDEGQKKWYKNGFSENGRELSFGNMFNKSGTYRISDGAHSEAFYYRTYLPEEFSENSGKYSSTEVSLEYTTMGASGIETTDFVGTQTGGCLSAVQYKDVPPRYIGMDKQVDKRATLTVDVIRDNGESVFGNVASEYYDASGGKHTREFILNTGYYTSANTPYYEYGPSFRPASQWTEHSAEDLKFYYPVSGLVGDTSYDMRYYDDGQGGLQPLPLSGKGLSAAMIFPGNIIGVSHGGMSVNPPLSVKGTERVEAFLSAIPSGMEASASLENEDSILWTYHSITYNTGKICDLHPAYETEEQLGIVRDKYTNVYTSAEKSYGITIRADVAPGDSWDGKAAICMDWDSFGTTVTGFTTGYMTALPEIRFVSPIVVANRNMSGYIPWYNESDTSKYDRFAVKGTNTDIVTELTPEETIYMMSGFKDAGYYGIEASGYKTVKERDEGVFYDEKPVYRVKEVFDAYASTQDIYVETYESWSSAVLRTPLSENISLDYTMTDLAIGPNELMTNDVINRRFEMLQHDLDQVKSISKYYHNPPTKFVGYVGYGSEIYASAEYSMDTYVSLRDHFGFWNSGDDSMQNRLDWQWCRSSSGEFVCPSAINLASATIVSGCTSMDIDDATMNIYATIGSKFKLGGMSSYTQVYETSGHVVKDRDYAEVNATEPRITSIKVMDDGKIFMLAPDFNRVLCYSRFNDMDSRTPYDMVFMYDFGGLGGGDSNLRFNNPIELAVDNGLHENIGQILYVLDEGNQCVKAFNSYGAFVAKVPYDLIKYNSEKAVSLAVGRDGTICVLTTHRILYHDLDGHKKGEYKLPRLNPLQICANKNSNFLYVLYDDDIVKVSTTGLFVGNFSVSSVWHKIGGWRVNEIPEFYGKIRMMAATKYDQIYLVLDNIVLIYADLLREMALAGNTYDKYSWSLDDIKIGKQEYMQDFVVNAALHRMYDNIDLFKRSIFGRIRVREKNGIKYIKTDNVMAREYAYLQDMPTKGEVFVPSNAPMSARVFNDNIELLYNMIVKLLDWCQV